MKRILPFFFILGAAALFTGCTEASKVRTAALKEAHIEFHKSLQKEADNRIDGKENLRREYVEEIERKSEFTLETVDVEGPSAQAHVQIKTIPPRVRLNLMGVINYRKGSSDFSFNIPDALNLVFKKMGKSPSERSTQDLQIHLKKDGKWKALSPSS